jgi:pSer/pThr/pTyr-binding forkhead associated (FHA) protein
MIECPTCKHREFVGTLFCSECGTRLVHVNPMPTKSISKDEIREESKTTRPTPPGPDLSSGALIGLRVISTGEIISLIGRDNFTLGRSIEGQAILPDVDLSRFDAYDFGLSRMHAELRIANQDTHIIDLESANGTIVNGKRILPNQAEPIEHGDIIQLGRLRLQVISRLG